MKNKGIISETLIFCWQILLLGLAISTAALAHDFLWLGTSPTAISFKTTLITALFVAWLVLFFKSLVHDIVWDRLRAMSVAKRVSYMQALAAVTSIAPLFQPEAMANSYLSAAGLVACAVIWATVLTLGYQTTFSSRARLLIAPITITGFFVLYAIIHVIWRQGMKLSSTPLISLSQAEKAMMPILLVTPLAVLAYISWYLLRGKLAANRPIGVVHSAELNGFPIVTWSQMAGGSETLASDDARGRLGVYFVLIGIFATAGLLSGSIQAMFLSALLGAWLGAMGLRGAGTMSFQGETLRHIPHVKTDNERREEVTPLVHQEDCMAFVEAEDGVLYFYLKRGNLDHGPLPTIERVPLNSIGNFEEGSHREWFRSKIATRELNDWGVIVAQSGTGRVLCVAESVGDRRWLVELLILLQKTFIENRPLLQMRIERTQREERKAKSEGPAVDRPHTSALSSSVPKREF